jgi:hypothetical protein
MLAAPMVSLERLPASPNIDDRERNFTGDVDTGIDPQNELLRSGI